MKIDETTIAAVTGGASGLGAATATALAARDAKVAILDMNKDLGTALAADTPSVLTIASATLVTIGAVSEIGRGGGAGAAATRPRSSRRNIPDIIRGRREDRIVLRERERASELNFHYLFIHILVRAKDFLGGELRAF